MQAFDKLLSLKFEITPGKVMEYCYRFSVGTLILPKGYESKSFTWKDQVVQDIDYI